MPKGNKELTAREAEALAFIGAEIDRGFPPTVREVQRRFKMKSSNSAQYITNSLIRKGHLQRIPGARGLQRPKEIAHA